VIGYRDPVVLPTGRTLERDIDCRRVDSSGTRRVFVPLRAWHPFTGHLNPFPA
jgi:hypothetical protein